MKSLRGPLAEGSFKRDVTMIGIGRKANYLVYFIKVSDDFFSGEADHPLRSKLS